MTDKQISTKETSSALETLDLREDSQVDVPTDVKKIELAPLPEQLESTEQLIDDLENVINEGSDGQEQASINPGGIVAASQANQAQVARYKEIEDVLADGLGDFYLDMDQLTQQKFKNAGEDAGRAIDRLIASGKCTARKVAEIIKKWLSLIPGVNKFFLEQEAKIKTDKIISLQRGYG